MANGKLPIAACSIGRCPPLTGRQNANKDRVLHGVQTDAAAVGRRADNCRTEFRCGRISEVPLKAAN